MFDKMEDLNIIMFPSSGNIIVNIVNIDTRSQQFNIVWETLSTLSIWVAISLLSKTVITQDYTDQDYTYQQYVYLIGLTRALFLYWRDTATKSSYD